MFFEFGSGEGVEIVFTEIGFSEFGEVFFFVIQRIGAFFFAADVFDGLFVAPLHHPRVFGFFLGFLELALIGF